jgi:hypothetical protein
LLNERPFNQDSYGVFLAKETGNKFDSLLVKYLENRFVDFQVKKDFADSVGKMEKPKTGARICKKKTTKVVKKKPVVQVMVNPKIKDKERQRSVPIGKVSHPPTLRDDQYDVRPTAGFFRQNSKVSRSQNLKRVPK